MVSLSGSLKRLVLAVLLSCPALARAEHAVLTLPSRDDGVPDGSVAEAGRAVAAYFASETPGTRVVPGESLPASVPAPLRACAVPSCAAELSRAAGADYAILVHVFAGDGSASAGSVSAAVVGGDGVLYAGAAAFGGEADQPDLASAARHAVGIARERHQRGPGPWLRVRAPEGSRVRVDGAAPVALPYLERHEPGLHRIEVAAPDGAVLLRTLVTLPEDPASYEDVLALGSTAAAKKAERGGYFTRPRSRWNYLLGVPLTALGVASVAAGVAHYAKRGDCVDRCRPDAQGGYNVYGVDALSRALVYGGAGLTAVGGVAFLAVGVLRDTAPGPRGMVLQLHGRF